MAFTMTITLTCFPDLPIELQKMIWEEAAADLPVISIQRFNAEIVLSQKIVHTRNQPRPLLICCTPHADFINLTTGHRGLLRACRESRKAAQRQIDCLLPIHYPTKDATGMVIPQQAFVPFNPSGYFCISGLGRAILCASRGRGARGSRLLRSQSVEDVIWDIQCLEATTTSLIKNLTIALDPTRVRSAQAYMVGWKERVLEKFASQMPNLKTVSLLSEAIINRRHHIDQIDFDRMHKTVSVVPENERAGGETAVPWRTLWESWRRQQILYCAITQSKIDEIERLQSQNSKGAALVNDAAMVARKTTLELNLRAIME